PARPLGRAIHLLRRDAAPLGGRADAAGAERRRTLAAALAGTTLAPGGGARMNPRPAPAGLIALPLYFVNPVRERGAYYQLAGLVALANVVVMLWRRGVTRAEVWSWIAPLAERPRLAAAAIFCVSFVLFSLPTLATRRPIVPMSSDEYGF